MSPIDRAAHLNRWRNRSLTEKASLALGMIVLALVLPPFPAAPLIAAIMIAATLLGAKTPVRIWLACAAAPVGFLLAGALALALQIDGRGLSFAPDGLMQAARLTMRSFAGLTCLLFLALTTPATDLVAGARRLGLPAEIAELALLMYHFLFLLAGTALAMDSAQGARLGHDGMRLRFRSLGVLIANLLPRSLDRARKLEMGLAARGWSGEMRVISRRAPVSWPALSAVVGAEAAVLVLGIWAQ